MAILHKAKAEIFATYVLCCVSVALLCTSAGTRAWLVSECQNTEDQQGSGNSRFGLFTGKGEFIILSATEKKFWIVCLEGLCMYSAEETEEEREASINQTINQYDLGRMSTGRLHRGPNALLLNEKPPLLFESERVPELMSEGLWVATITMLFAGLVFAVLGATFAVINTATTPIEFITGVPGLYVWNGCAAVCGLACVILWGIQYSLHLTSNVLIENAEEGWTTEGLQHLGYSYWLVVVSVVVHLANCIIIGVGTYERKVKTQYEAPETKPGNIMLY